MDKNQADDDFEMVRQTYHDLLSKGGSSLEDMMEVARATEHPRIAVQPNCAPPRPSRDAFERWRKERTPEG